MLYYRCLPLLLASCVTFSFAVPVPDTDKELSLVTREPLANDDLGDVFLMARTPPRSTVDAANQVIHRQANVEANKKVYKERNNEKFGSIKGSPTKWNAAIRDQQKKAKDTRKANSESLAKFKAEVKKEQPPKVRQPKAPGTPKQLPPTQVRQKGEIRKGKADKREERLKERKRVGQELKDAAEKMKNTKNLPDRNSKFDEFDKPTTGKEVRKAVMLHHLNEKKPVGDFPKIVGDPAAPIPQKEYPVRPWGWTGASNGYPGNNRIVMSGNKLDAVTGLPKPNQN